MFDNTGTYQTYVIGRDGVAGRSLKTWPEMRLPERQSRLPGVGGDGRTGLQGRPDSRRTLTGICNDIRNPLMGSAGMPFAPQR